MSLETLFVKTEAEEVSVKEEAEEECDNEETGAHVKKEAECEDSVALCELYADHQIKDELVLGPEEMHRPCVAPTLPVAGDGAEEALGRACSVRLERLLVDAALRSRRVGRHTYTLPSTSETSDCTNTSSESYQCDHCGDTFKDKSVLRKHIDTHSLEPSGDFNKSALPVSNQASAVQLQMQSGPVLRECFVRLERIPLESALILSTVRPRGARHGATEPHSDTDASNGANYVCAICDSIFKRKYKLIQHIQTHIQKKIIDSHDVTGNSCNTPGNFETQYKCKPYVCDTCGKQFKQSSHLGRHKRIHTENNLYSCNICNKGYTRLNNLRDHKWIHTGQTPYSCKICSKQFTQLRSLKAHKLIHTGDKPYSCEICKAHTLIHTGDKPYSCEICKKEFTRSNIMKSHKRTHTGEILHTCEICKKRFTGLNNIKRHKRTHTGEMPYSCEICKKGFTRKSNLQEHIRIHLEGKSYPCDICNKWYTRLRTLRLHKKQFHMLDQS